MIAEEKQSPAMLLSLEGAGLRFGNVQALSDVTMQVRQGEFIALIGANGSGKTSLLQALHGLLPLSGRRLVAADCGRQVMVFQRPFMLRLSVWRNLLLALWLAGVPRPLRAARASEALQRAGLSSLRDRPARALSGGQQQRLALARAWAVRPGVLFLDEPTANLDPSAKNEIEAMLAGFMAEGMTLIMSTHNLGQAKRLASRVIYLDRGKIRADLPSAVFFKEHALDARLDLFLKGELTWDLL
ncbi:ATP-binding cassette domain-containing protein [Roseateles oligotrophus]|uniref:ATP-binding cassette domain-containing protein n=1 Tax=Roseateles oligotrophus TaxID=1769250 RepID=A0ABT2Y971_9BURK|nr:ATP-binding cassette domain-containing protein [Roseateles oligotrophus]MCV2366852.1 ATP-binding cassette domain-containing protein [Roseateles oligotrophus]